MFMIKGTCRRPIYCLCKDIDLELIITDHRDSERLQFVLYRSRECVYHIHDEPQYPHQYREITPFSRHCARLYLLEYLWNFSDTKEALEYIYEKFFSVDLSFHMSGFFFPNNDRVGWAFQERKKIAVSNMPSAQVCLTT